MPGAEPPEEGTRWEVVGSGITNDLHGVTSGGAGDWVAVGNRVILHSPQGTTWSAAAVTPPPTNLLAVATDGSRWLATGSGWVHASVDGRNWSGDAVGFQAATLAWGQGTWAAAGWAVDPDSPIPHLGIWTSEDGRAWTRRARDLAVDPLLNVSYEFASLTFDGTRWGILRRGTTPAQTSSTILGTTDVTSWPTLGVDFFRQRLAGLATMDGQWGAVGDARGGGGPAPVQLVSTQGTEWSVVDASDQFQLVGVRNLGAGGGQWHALLADGSIEACADLQRPAAWSRRFAGSGVSLEDVAYHRRRWVAVGGQGLIVTGRDPVGRWDQARFERGSGFQARLRGPSGQVCQIQFSADLQSWSHVAVVTNDTGIIEFRAPEADGTGPRFYRAVER